MRIRPLALVLVSFPLALAGILVGCGGDDAVVVNDAGGSDASVNDGAVNDAGNPQPDGGASDGGGSDGGPTPPPVEAGASNPGKITCGTTECDSTTQVCCLQFSFDAGATRKCTTQNGCQGQASECDEKADCPQNQRCCLSQGFTRGQCQNSCQGGTQACKTNPECGDGGVCATHTCPQNVVIQTCTKPNLCN